MAVRLIPNQLVKLYDTETLNQRNKRLTLDYRTYCQIVREEQTTMFQLQLLDDSENLVTNGDFVDNISGWNIVTPTWQWASGRLQGIIDGNIPFIFQQITVTTGNTYRLTGTAQFTNTTSSLLVAARNVTQGSINITKYEASEYGTGPFDFEVFFYADGTTQVSIEFVLNGAQRDLVFIDDVGLYELTEPTVRLETCDGDLVATIPVFARSNDYISYAVDWLGKDEGCYRICIEGVDDTEKNYLDRALALGTEGGSPIELAQGGFLKWFG